MNKNTLLKISTAIIIASSTMSPASAAPDDTEKEAAAARQSAGTSIQASVNNGRGVVTYNGDEVWKGRVRKSLKAVAQASGDKDKYEGDYAAAWDGDELVWENVPGAGKELEGMLPNLPHLEEKQKKKKKSSRRGK